MGRSYGLSLSQWECLGGDAKLYKKSLWTIPPYNN